METYKIVSTGKSIQHLLNIPPELLNVDFEITIKPIKSGNNLKKKIEFIMKKYKNVEPFQTITDPVNWQQELRDEW